MRFLLILTALVAIGYSVKTYHKEIYDFGLTLGDEIVALNYDKQIDYSGIHLLVESELAPLIPREKSVWWWLFNPESIEAAVSRSPFISEVSVEPCSSFLFDSWGCFSISVVERVPSFIAEIEGDYWVVGQDGGFIAPAPKKISIDQYLSSLESKFGKLRVVRGLSAVRSSPDLVQARFTYARQAMDLIEQVSTHALEWGELRPNGEFAAKLSNWNLIANFDYDPDRADGLRQESERLKVLLEQFEGREHRIREIDLAFQKSAIVKLHEEETPQPKAQG